MSKFLLRFMAVLCLVGSSSHALNFKPTECKARINQFNRMSDSEEKRELAIAIKRVCPGFSVDNVKLDAAIAWVPAQHQANRDASARAAPMPNVAEPLAGAAPKAAPPLPPRPTLAPRAEDRPLPPRPEDSSDASSDYSGSSSFYSSNSGESSSSSGQSRSSSFVSGSDSGYSSDSTVISASRSGSPALSRSSSSSSLHEDFSGSAPYNPADDLTPPPSPRAAPSDAAPPPPPPMPSASAPGGSAPVGASPSSARNRTDLMGQIRAASSANLRDHRGDRPVPEVRRQGSAPSLWDHVAANMEQRRAGITGDGQDGPQNEHQDAYPDHDW